MKFPHSKTWITGMSIPVLSLKSADNMGAGEFYDLLLLAEWCCNTSLDLIQILPVNDTGTQSSPYSALSAYALHPIYISLKKLEGFSEIEIEWNKYREKFDKAAKVPFYELLTAKQNLLAKLFEMNRQKLLDSKEISKWLQKNEWVKIYAVYSFLKTENQEKPWMNWDKDTDPDQSLIEEIFTNQKENLFKNVWIQYELDKQFRYVSEQLTEKKIALKGDLPILMNEDSADVWFYKDLFIRNLRAGAPPDMFSTTGQNWGFPIYSWENQEKNNYKWWQNRLKQASRYYHALRIDHVLGFFRIWAIKTDEFSGRNGFFMPSEGFTRSDLSKLGFSEERIEWMKIAHIPGNELRSQTGDDSDFCINTIFIQVKGEDLYTFKKEYKNEQKLLKLTLSDSTKQSLLNFYRNRLLIEKEINTYSLNYCFHETRAFHSLSEAEKNMLLSLWHQKQDLSEITWKQHAENILGTLSSGTDMLICAENLGVVPSCVAPVLEKLNILSLEMLRWTIKEENGKRFFQEIDTYPYLSVSTPAVHDSSCLREWWKEDNKEEICKLLKIEYTEEFKEETAVNIFKSMQNSSSRLVIFMLQDLLAMDRKYWTENPAEERINTPGTVSESNWTYKMPVELDRLIDDKNLSGLIKKITNSRCVKGASHD